MSFNSGEARRNFSELLSKAAYAKKRTVLTRRGKKVAAIVPIEDLEIIEALEDSIDYEEAKKALKDVKKHGTIPWGKLKSELGL